MKESMMFDCCCPECKPEPSGMTKSKDYMLASNRPQLRDDSFLDVKTTNKPLDTGMTMRQPL